MEINVVRGDPVTSRVDAVIISIFEDMQRTESLMRVDSALGGAISILINDGEIKGKMKDITLVHTMGKIEPKKVVIAGLGKRDQLNVDKLREVIAEACRMLRKTGCTKIAIVAHDTDILDPEQEAQAIAEGCILGLYQFRRHITKDPEYGEVQELLIIEHDGSNVASLERGCRRGKIIAEAANMARDMANEPANKMTPSDMARIAKDIADNNGLEITILDRDRMRELGMGGLLGVSQGSAEPPKFIVLNYKGDGNKNIGLIGKGLTFDSGGISIKPSENMGEMKGDMSGGAAVIAAMDAIAKLKPAINVTAIIPATENLPSGTALKPGDVIKAMNGKTIEVVNTDAEGRLILADALSYANTLGISRVIDVATLTGACMVALGTICTGVFGNNQDFIDTVLKASAESGEKFWQMPMFEEYKEQNKSDVADIKNSGGRYGGAITAAQFLAEFVGDTPWVHLDIAGTMRIDKDQGYYVKGATGVPVRTLVELVCAIAQ